MGEPSHDNGGSKMGRTDSYYHSFVECNINTLQDCGDDVQGAESRLEGWEEHILGYESKKMKRVPRKLVSDSRWRSLQVRAWSSLVASRITSAMSCSP